MSKHSDPLLQPLRIGDMTVPNRVLMAPLTRARADRPGDAPLAMNVEYYRQRAGSGLILTEASQISPQGKDFAFPSASIRASRSRAGVRSRDHASSRPEPVIDAVRSRFSRTYIGNGAYSADGARRRIDAGRCDVVTFGRPAIGDRRSAIRICPNVSRRARRSTSGTPRPSTVATNVDTPITRH